MSLSLEKFNTPAWNEDGVKNKVSILLADAYNNPAEDDTAVYFTTEGGSIEPSCLTKNGACVVNWTSQAPRPARTNPDYSTSRVLCLNLEGDDLRTCEAERAGRSTILATAIGNESFKDQNGNGTFDIDKDLPVFKTSTDGTCSPNVPTSSFESTNSDACDDLGEAYLDANENGIHDAGEHFINFITDTSNDTKDENDPSFGTNYTLNNGIYNGAFCQADDEADGKCSRSPVTIRKEHLIIMSCSSPLLVGSGNLPKIGTDASDANQNIYAVADCNGNPLPVGTTITVGSNPAITIANQYNWTAISAPAGTIVKLSIALDSGTKDVSIITN
jgi:hypothetical protein